MITIRMVLYICYHQIIVVKQNRLCCKGTIKCKDLVNHLLELMLIRIMQAAQNAEVNKSLVR